MKTLKKKATFFMMLTGMLLLTAPSAMATKFLGIHIIDKDYLMVHFRDGEVHYRDNGTGPSAYLGHSFAEGDDTLLVFGERLKVGEAQQAALWRVSSADDKAFAAAQPVNIWRKSKPMNTDNTLSSELDHWLFIQLPQSMRQGCSYTVSIPDGIGADQTTATIRFDEKMVEQFYGEKGLNFPIYLTFSREIDSYKITGFGQGVGDEYIFFVLKDGNLAMVSVYTMLKDKNYNPYMVKGVKDITAVQGGSSYGEYGGGHTNFAVTKDKTAYDLQTLLPSLAAASQD